MTTATIRKSISVIRAVYAVVAVIALIALWFDIVSQSFDSRFLTAVCAGSVCGLSFWGLLKMRPWLPTYILYMQALGLLAAVMPLRDPTIVDFLFKWSGVVFAAGQLWFFTRPEVRRCFEARGHAVY